jgi:cell division protein FtsL
MADETRTHQVTLGCGTLILIALIVMFFSNRGSSNVQHEVRELRDEIVELRKASEAQTQQIRQLTERLDKAKGPE